MELSALLTETVRRKASDLHLAVGLPPIFRIDGELIPYRSASKAGNLCESPVPLEDDAVEDLLAPYLSDTQREQMATRDLMLTVRQDGCIFRCQVFRERGQIAAALRVVPQRVPSLEELGLRSVLEKLTHAKRGLVLVTGPTGSGKSTTVAALLEHINMTRSERIITIEDPIQYVLKSKLSLISQRQVGEDVESYEQGILTALNSDLDIALIGELRDMATVRLALILAETGHLVFSTLGVETVSEAVQRLIEVFPEPRADIRRLLARTLQAVVAQRLLPTTEAYRKETGLGRVAANEILLCQVPRIRQMLMEDQPNLTLAMEADHEQGMQTMDEAVLHHYRAGHVSYDVAALHMEDRSRLGPPTSAVRFG